MGLGEELPPSLQMVTEKSPTGIGPLASHSEYISSLCWCGNYTEEETEAECPNHSYEIQMLRNCCPISGTNFHPVAWLCGDSELHLGWIQPVQCCD